MICKKFGQFGQTVLEEKSKFQTNGQLDRWNTDSRWTEWFFLRFKKFLLILNDSSNLLLKFTLTLTSVETLFRDNKVCNQCDHYDDSRNELTYLSVQTICFYVYRRQMHFNNWASLINVPPFASIPLDLTS